MTSNYNKERLKLSHQQLLNGITVRLYKNGLKKGTCDSLYIVATVATVLIIRIDHREPEQRQAQYDGCMIHG